jgi:hypothetical protein
VHGFNAEGLRRRGFSRERIALVKQMHRLLYRDGLTLEQARTAIAALAMAAWRSGDADVAAAAGLPGRQPRAASCADGPGRMRLAMVAGEASGDLLAGLLLGGLRQRWPGCRPQGIGGPRWPRRASRPGGRSDKLAVRGYVEVLRHYREISGIRERPGHAAAARAAAAFIGVDAPDFNLGLEARLRPPASRRSTSSARRSGPGAAAA